MSTTPNLLHSNSPSQKACRWVLAFIAGITFTAFGGARDDKSGSPEQCLSVFYNCLLSDKPVAKCPDCFTDSEAFYAVLPDDIKKQAQKLTKASAVWLYLRSRKAAFLFPGIDPQKMMKTPSLGYCFIGFGKGQFFFEGNLCIILFGRFSLEDSQEKSVEKQIMFPLERVVKPEGYSYRINLFAVTVNGVWLDPSMDGKRKGDFYRTLGIESGGQNH